MLELPSRETLVSLTRAARAVAPVQVLGFARSLDDARVEMLFFHINGVSEHIVRRSEVPAVLRPSVGDARQEEARWIGANPEGVVEFLLTLGNVRRVASFRRPQAFHQLVAMEGRAVHDGDALDVRRAASRSRDYG
jgi:hypothetical protein